MPVANPSFWAETIPFLRDSLNKGCDRGLDARFGSNVDAALPAGVQAFLNPLLLTLCNGVSRVHQEDLAPEIHRRALVTDSQLTERVTVVFSHQSGRGCRQAGFGVSPSGVQFDTSG